MRRLFAALALAPALLAGCATIATDAGQLVRVDTFAQSGEEISGAQCRLENDRGVVNLTTPGAATVRKSAGDLRVHCSAANLSDAKAVVTSRVGAGMFGNIIFGGGVGAIIDHSKGTAYNYPTWLQLVFGQSLSFDRQEHLDGQPTPAFVLRDGQREPFARPGATPPRPDAAPTATTSTR